VLRLLVLYFLVIIEYFQRTQKEDEMRTLRSNVRKLTWDEECAVLYVDDEEDWVGDRVEVVR